MMLLVVSTHPQEADAFEVSVELPQGSRCIYAACVRIPGPDAPVVAALEASAIDLGGSHALRRSSDNIMMTERTRQSIAVAQSATGNSTS